MRSVRSNESVTIGAYLGEKTKNISKDSSLRRERVTSVWHRSWFEKDLGMMSGNRYWVFILIAHFLIACSVIMNVAVARRVKHVPNNNMESEEIPMRRLLVEALQNGHYFQDIFSQHLAPLEIEFGHVCENPSEWEQRFERKDMKNNQHQGKVRWGNKNGEYGEHYWDLNHGVN